MFHRDGQRAIADERPLTRNRFVANDSQRVHVAGRNCVFAEGLLGCDVLGRAHHHPGLGHWHRVDRFGDAKVGEFDLAVRCDEDVSRFDVTVHQACGVGDLKCPAGLLEHV